MVYMLRIIRTYVTGTSNECLIMKFDLGNHKRSQIFQEEASKLENYRLLDKPMLQALFPKAVINHERLLRLTKSLVAIYSIFD